MGACRSIRFGGGFRHSPGPGRGLLPAVLAFALALVAFHSLHAADERHTRFGEGLTFLYHEVDAALAEELWPLMVADRKEIMERLRLYPPGTLRVRPGEVVVRLGEPVSVEDVNRLSRDELLERTRAFVLRHVPEQTPADQEERVATPGSCVVRLDS